MIIGPTLSRQMDRMKMEFRFKFPVMALLRPPGGSTHMFGHSDGNHELLQERFKLGYQNYIYSFDTVTSTVSVIIHSYRHHVQTCMWTPRGGLKKRFYFARFDKRTVSSLSCNNRL